MNVVKGNDGQEYFLLASIERAKEIFEKYGFLSGNTLNIGRWVDIGGYPIYTKRNILKMSEKITESIIKGTDNRLRHSELSKIQNNLVEPIVGFAASTQADVGYNLRQYFYPENTGPINEYITSIRSVLLELGVPEKNIIDVPSLLFQEKYSPYSQNPHPPRVASTHAVPIYAPVNGIQMNIGPDSPPSFFTVGGLKLLDDVITYDLASIGIKHVPLPSAISLGYALSGFRCVTVPWR